MKLPRLSRKTWIVLGVAVVLGAIWFFTPRFREGLEASSGGLVLTGGDISGEVQVTEKTTTPNGNQMLFAIGDGKVRVAITDPAASNVYLSGYVSGGAEKIAELKSAGNSIESKLTSSSYKVKRQTATAAPAATAPAATTPSPSAPPSTTAASASGAYAATCTKCTVVNNQLSCSCDVTPK